MDPRPPAGRHARVFVAVAAVQQAAGALDAFCAAEQLPADVAWRLRVALDEIVANIVAYAAPAPGSAALDVWFRRDGAAVEITVADDGPAFDPLAHPAPDTTRPLQVRQPGGIGIALVRSLMDEVRYERTTRNVLTLRKRFDDSSGGAVIDAHRAE